MTRVLDARDSRRTPLRAALGYATDAQGGVAPAQSTRLPARPRYRISEAGRWGGIALGWAVWGPRAGEGSTASLKAVQGVRYVVSARSDGSVGHHGWRAGGGTQQDRVETATSRAAAGPLNTPRAQAPTSSFPPLWRPIRRLVNSASWSTWTPRPLPNGYALRSGRQTAYGDRRVAAVSHDQDGPRTSGRRTQPLAAAASPPREQCFWASMVILRDLSIPVCLSRLRGPESRSHGGAERSRDSACQQRGPSRGPWPGGRET
ncbi:hypothetical protein SAMN06272775_6984 [Streptomyces sp. 2323.1]|nr:hypothetical protein SAMN06272775_6984 [Streptomyces sp. 2323.1]